MATMPNDIRYESHDPLTGLGTLAELGQVIDEWCDTRAAGSESCPVQAMLITLGRIDTVNVAFGETTGDGALVEVAQRIRHFAADELESEPWLAARVSGGAFVLAAHARMPAERWQWLAEALADALAAPIAQLGSDGSIRLWPRVALLRAGQYDDVHAMLDRLTEVTARLQQLPGRRIAWSSDLMASAARSSLELEADLLAAIDRDEIELLFQPQYSLVEDRMIGAEALARWHHPIVGPIGAASLFQIAERADHVAHLSRHIARRSLEQALHWPDHLRLSINITPTDLAADNFAIDFARLAERIGFPLSRLTLEITEQVLLADLDRVGNVLQQLKMLDARIALDDFGAGFCNFRYLKVLPIDCIKLDKTMVEGVLDDERDRAVFRAIVSMAKALDLRVMVEGIETDAQRDFVAAEDCEYFQGYLKAKPLSAHAFLNLALRN